MGSPTVIFMAIRCHVRIVRAVSLDYEVPVMEKKNNERIQLSEVFGLEYN